jgi:hypothetical protein
MQITRLLARERKLSEGLDVKELEGVHLTDLLGCLRRAYYRQVDPLPPTARMKVYNVRGTIFQRKYYGRHNSGKSIVTPIGGGEIVASPDNPHDRSDFKTTGKAVQSPDLLEGFAEQGAFYAWLHGQTWWIFDILHIGASYPRKNDIPYWAPREPDEVKSNTEHSYRLNYTETEIEEVVAKVLDRAELLQQYLRRSEIVKSKRVVVMCLPTKEPAWYCDECPHKFVCELES